VHKELYSDHMKNYMVALMAAKTDYFASVVSSGEGNSRTIFSVLNSLIF